eukprot:jgi/Orpsp1_1/1190920/evm.model.d7180000082148.1
MMLLIAKRYCYRLLNVIMRTYLNVFFEKLLLRANRNNNKNILTIMIELLLFKFDESSKIRDYHDGKDKFNSIHLSIIKLCHESFTSLVLNTLIRLHLFDTVKYLVENDELKNNLNINTEDKNKDFPICVASEVINEDVTTTLNLFEYLIEHGANYYVCHNNNIPLFIYNIKTGNYHIIQNLLLKQNISIEQYIDEGFYTYFDKGGREGEIKLVVQDKLRSNNKNELVKISDKSKVDQNNKVNFLFDNFNPITIIYLLNYQEVFYSMINNVNINELDGYGYSILHYCQFKNDIDRIKYLVNSLDANVNYIKNKNLHGHSAINICISMKNET